MAIRNHSNPPARPSVYFFLLAAFMSIAWLTGGASRADALGQVVLRAAAWAFVVVAVLVCPRPSLSGTKPVAFVLVASLVLVLLQLVPLPPALWQSLPGRAVLAEAAEASGQSQPWRPLAIVPSATINAAMSLIVPFTVLFLYAGLRERERSWIPGLLLSLVTAAMLVGLLQFSGAGFNNPFVNDAPGQVSGTFANRNHFALFLAMGCLLAPIWAFLNGRRPRWRGLVALGLVLLFALTILASGSRAGIIVGMLALGFGLLLAWRGLRRELRHAPRWAFPALIGAIIGTVAIFVLVSVAADRAESINRVITIDAAGDMRRRGLPTVLAMIRSYFPIGTGFGSFDTMFRMNEPFALLKFTYFNHAHNDLLEIALDGGVPGLILLVAGLVWAAIAGVQAWRQGGGAEQARSKGGAVLLLLVLVASTIDYPARTPMIMAMMVISGLWLADRKPARLVSTLPGHGQHL